MTKGCEMSASRFTGLLLVVFGMMLLLGSLTPANAQMELGVTQAYSKWKPYPNRENVYYCTYFYKEARTECYQYNYVIWYTGTKRGYCYSPYRKCYWGCWVWQTGPQPTWNFCMAQNPQPGVRPTDQVYGTPGAIPNNPATNQEQMIPPDLPPI